MKRLIYALCAIIVVTSCQNQQDDLQPFNEELENISQIGSRISKEDGSSWIESYQLQNPNQIKGFLFGKDILNEILEKEGAVGIWFFNAIDGAGESKLVLYPADENGQILRSNDESGRVEEGQIGEPFDSGQKCPPDCPDGDGLGRSNNLVPVIKIGSSIEASDAVNWINRFQEKYPNKVRAHLFGEEIIRELLTTKGSEGIWFFYGLNESDEEKMVLYSADSDGKLWGLTASGAARAENDGGLSDPADNGKPCPPYCG